MQERVETVNKFDPASEKRLIEIADLLWQIQKTYSRTDRSTPLTREEIEAMKMASSDIHGILHPTPGLGRFNDPPNDKIANAWEQDDDSQDWRRYKAGHQDEDESLALVARPRAEAMPDGSINTPSVHVCTRAALAVLTLHLACLRSQSKRRR
jgi:hypothetical protein